MSNEHLTWARGIVGLSTAEKLVLFLIADRVRSDGMWTFKLNVLAREACVTRNPLRRALDGLAHKGYLVFREERYIGCASGRAQGAHTFFLLRDKADAKLAATQGFSASRKVLDRTGDAADGAPLSGPMTTHSGSGCDPTVGQHADPQRKTLETDPDKQPSSLGVVIDNGSQEQGESDVLWTRFFALYPRDPLDPPAPGRKVFLALSVEDQKAALAGLGPYLRLWTARGLSGRHVFRKRWLEERRWEGVVVTSTQEVGVRVYEGTCEHRAWAKALEEIGRTWVAPHTDRDGRSYCIKRNRFPDS